MLRPFNFHQWIEQNRQHLQPPVGNKQVFFDSTFIVMVVGGPNERTDFHVNQSDEFFYQLTGDMTLKIMEQSGQQNQLDPQAKPSEHPGQIIDIPIAEGEVFMLKGGIPHSPQRLSGSIGLVVEKARSPTERDGLQWYCEQCCHKLYEEFFPLTDIETQFGAVFERYYSGGHGHCPHCGHHNGRKWHVKN